MMRQIVKTVQEGEHAYSPVYRLQKKLNFWIGFIRYKCNPFLLAAPSRMIKDYHNGKAYHFMRTSGALLPGRCMDQLIRVPLHAQVTVQIIPGLACLGLQLLVRAERRSEERSALMHRNHDRSACQSGAVCDWEGELLVAPCRQYGCMSCACMSQRQYGLKGSTAACIVHACIVHACMTELCHLH